MALRLTDLERKKIKRLYNKGLSILLNVKQVKTRDNQGGVYYFQPGEIILKGNYESEKKCSKVKEYKLSPEELAAYLKELETKKVKRRGE